MKRLVSVLGIMLAVAGIVWILQGVGLLPGSFMSGQIRWAIYGLAAAGLGVGLLVIANRRARRS